MIKNHIMGTNGGGGSTAGESSATSGGPALFVVEIGGERWGD